MQYIKYIPTQEEFKILWFIEYSNWFWKRNNVGLERIIIIYDSHEGWVIETTNWATARFPGLLISSFDDIKTLIRIFNQL